MADIAAYLVDQLLPEAGYRQWVLTFPWTLRFRLAVDRKLFSALISAYLRTLFAWQRRRGWALNLHPHAHSLLPDGTGIPGSRQAPVWTGGRLLPPWCAARQGRG